MKLHTLNAVAGLAPFATALPRNIWTPPIISHHGNSTSSVTTAPRAYLASVPHPFLDTTGRSIQEDQLCMLHKPKQCAVGLHCVGDIRDIMGLCQSDEWSSFSAAVTTLYYSTTTSPAATNTEYSTTPDRHIQLGQECLPNVPEHCALGLHYVGHWAWDTHNAGNCQIDAAASYSPITTLVSPILSTATISSLTTILYVTSLPTLVSSIETYPIGSSKSLFSFTRAYSASTTIEYITSFPTAVSSAAMQPNTAVY